MGDGINGTKPLRSRARDIVVCLSRAPGLATCAPLKVEEATSHGKAREGAGENGPPRMSLVFGTGPIAMCILAGRSELQNLVRSWSALDARRFDPFEWKLVAGTIDSDVAFGAAAHWEFEDELHVNLLGDEDAASLKQTRPVGSVSKITYSFDAIAEESRLLFFI